MQSTPTSDRISDKQAPLGTEQQVREELAALYRLAAHFRMTDMIDTHITARLPGSPGEPPAFLINRYGVLFHEMRASDLVKIDHLGNVIDERARSEPALFRVNAAGFTIHSAIHAARANEAAQAPSNLQLDLTSRHPGMHRTESVDYALVMSGEITMLLDDDSETHLTAGDVVIMQGTYHAWANRGDQPCTIAFILVGAEVPWKK